MSAATRDLVRMATGAQLPSTYGRSSQVACDNPLFLETGLIDPATGAKVPGLPVGTCGRQGSGGAFLFSTPALFKAGLLASTHTKRFGEVGTRKSGDMKTEILLGTQVGRNYIQLDPKDEYTELAKAIPGSRVFSFDGDSDLRISPVDRMMELEEQHDLMQSLVVSAMKDKRPLHSQEIDALWKVLEIVRAKPGTPVLGDVFTELTEPRVELIEYVAGSEEWSRREYFEAIKEIKSLIRALDTGRLRSVFHEPTTEGLWNVVPFLVLRCKGLKDEKLALVLNVLNFMTAAVGRRQKNMSEQNRFDYINLDEVWYLAKDPGFLASIVALFKLGNSEGLTVNIVAHHPSNLFGYMDADAVKPLLSDSATTILRTMNEAELRPYADMLNLTERDVELVTSGLELNEALYKIGKRSILVQHTAASHPQILQHIETRHDLKTD